MKRLLILTALFLVSMAVVQAQSSSKKKQIERIAVKVAETNDLSRLNGARLLNGQVKIVIDNSDADIGQKEFEVRSFRSFKGVERWLKSRETEDGFPIRETRPLSGCRNGSCIFDFDGGILHNHLYLKKILYGFQKNRFFIKALYFLNG